MSSAKKCDRCGNFFESSVHGGTEVNLTLINDRKRIITFNCGHNPDLDLCPDCVESFEHWWANETVIPITKKRGKKEIKEIKNETDK